MGDVLTGGVKRTHLLQAWVMAYLLGIALAEQFDDSHRSLEHAFLAATGRPAAAEALAINEAHGGTAFEVGCHNRMVTAGLEVGA